MLSGNKPLTSKPDDKTAAETQLIARRKAAKMLIAVVVMFGICYLPVHLLNILRFDFTITFIICLVIKMGKERS